MATYNPSNYCEGLKIGDRPVLVANRTAYRNGFAVFSIEHPANHTMNVDIEVHISRTKIPAAHLEYLRGLPGNPLGIPSHEEMQVAAQQCAEEYWQQMYAAARQSDRGNWPDPDFSGCSASVVV